MTDWATTLDLSPLSTPLIAIGNNGTCVILLCVFLNVAENLCSRIFLLQPFCCTFFIWVFCSLMTEFHEVDNNANDILHFLLLLGCSACAA